MSNKFLLLSLSTILILVWGVDFTASTPLVFGVLALSYPLMAIAALTPYIQVRKSLHIQYKEYWPYLLYVVWFAVCTVRGIPDIHTKAAEVSFASYLIAGLLTSTIFVALNPDYLRSWIGMFWKYGWIFAVVLLPFKINYSFYFHYFLIIIVFWSFIKKNNKIWLLVALAFALKDLDPRAHVIKYLIALLVFWQPTHKLLRGKIVKILSIACLVTPFILLTTGILGIFNPFKMDEYIDTDMKVTQDGEEFDVTMDTRTVIYEDVITSAILHNEVMQGSNIAKGNDSRFFDGDMRLMNESSLLNHFTKMGLIGVLLLFSVFVGAVYYAVFRSNNNYIKLVGLFVAFRWIMLWIEDMEQFSCLYLSVWLMLGMCYAPSLRNMSDNEFSRWAKTLSLCK